MDIGCKVLVFFTCFFSVTAEIYIVTMEGEPIISYKGGDNGFQATAVESDEKIDTTRYLCFLFFKLQSYSPKALLHIAEMILQFP